MSPNNPGPEGAGPNSAGPASARPGGDTGAADRKGASPRDARGAAHPERTVRDPSLAAARYRLQKAAGETGEATVDERPRPTAAQLRAIAKTSLDIAIDRGDFDDLPLAGKPLPGLAGGTVDPNWWIKGLIEREGLSGVAPPALSLRTENAQLDDLLDAMATEASVRAHLAGFNDRIVEARRQLTGGPPVVTPLRDLDAEVVRWSERRQERRRQASQAAEVAAADVPPTWRERRRAALEAGEHGLQRVAGRVG
ncbi:DnaJ family domain-containing protein, partial [Frondihabitans cladoniiphilus]|uniref:DnaJ family domain-containing protein n=1 Tax=Frondihabitans cladoniiphilus TaxID=715785 RepID=UPI0031EC7C61